VISTKELLEQYAKHISSGGARLFRLLSAPVIERAEGSHLYSSTGERYLSCGGFAVFLMGHQHPEIVEPVAEQLHKMALCGPGILHEGQVRAAEALAGICDEGMEYAFFLNSGAEATELGIKLARLGGKRRLISTEGGYHGKTIGALSATGREIFRAPFEPLLAGVTFVPYDDLDALAAEVSEDSCVVLEPIQGEGGVRVPAAGYLSEVARLCAARGALLMLDEIQTGLGRTGYMWDSQAEGVCPDILLTGKALGGGVVPVSAVVTNERVFAPLGRDPILHSSTSGGNPIAAAAVTAAIDVIRRHDLPARAAQLGDRLQGMIREVLQEGCPQLLADVRGRGLLIGVEMRDPAYAAELILELLERRVVISSTLNSYSTVRLTPSAFFDEEDIAWLRGALEETAQALAARHPHVPGEPERQTTTAKGG
jgi:putrescine aminotransferase